MHSTTWTGCPQASRSQEDTVVDEELQRNVTRLIGTLPKKLRDALLLAGTGEHTYEQISQMLGPARHGEMARLGGPPGAEEEAGRPWLRI